MTLTNPQTGLVGSGNTKTGLSAWLQHHLVGTGTHAFIIDYPTGSKGDIPQVFESDMRVSNDTWQHYLDDTNFDIWLYSINGATKEEIEYALDFCIKKFLGDMYGFAEWLYFPYRMFCQKILHIDVRKQDNFFKRWALKGCICTELWWWYIWALTGGIVVRPKYNKLRQIISEYNPDAMTANDVLHIQEDNQDLFTLQYMRLDGQIKFIRS
jgi:hypothetical protein